MTSPTTDIAESRSYWTHGIKDFPSPVAQFRMAQLIDLDDRLYENARVVYRFLIGWYHDGHGDALLSMRHVSKVMRARAPDGATVLSHSVVQRAVIALMDTGWVVRTYKGRGKGKGASRFMPVFNVLELAGQGKFPEPSHCSGTVDGDGELTRSIGTAVSHANGTVEPELTRPNGTKTTITDSGTDPRTSNSNDVSLGDAAAGLAPAAPAGFERIWNAYGRLGHKATSRVEWAKLVDPDVDHIAGRAASWAASARPGQKRMPLEKWLAAEKYDEADRQVAPRPTKTASNNNRPAAIRGGETDLPKGDHRLEVVDFVDANWMSYESSAELKLRAEDGREYRHVFHVCSRNAAEERAGRDSYQALGKATGENIEPGVRLLVTVTDVVTYSEAAA